MPGPCGGAAVTRKGHTELLVPLSGGKPDDSDLYYRSDYGIEDTRRALFEARREMLHAYCIPTDKEGQEYLPHMYGVANYGALDAIAKLPPKVSHVRCRITS